MSYAQQKTHSSQIQVQLRAKSLIQSGHFNPEGISAIAVEVGHRWQHLMTHAEDRHKLVTSSLNFFRTSKQVLSVLESLEREYLQEEDYCGASAIDCTNVTSYLLRLSASCTPSSQNSLAEEPKESRIANAIIKHQKQKEAFLKACTLCRRNAETFLKYAVRCVQYYASRSNNILMRNAKQKVNSVLDEVLNKENLVLDSWTQRKKRLDQCQQFYLVEHSAQQAMRWIKEQGEEYLRRAVESGLGNTLEESQAILINLNEFKISLRDTREKVRLLIQLGDNLVERGHVHGSIIRAFVTAVENSFRDLVTRLEAFRSGLEEKLGLKQSDRNSDSSLDIKYTPTPPSPSSTMPPSTPISGSTAASPHQKSFPPFPHVQQSHSHQAAGVNHLIISTNQSQNFCEKTQTSSASQPPGSCSTSSSSSLASYSTSGPITASKDVHTKISGSGSLSSKASISSNDSNSTTTNANANSNGQIDLERRRSVRKKEYIIQELLGTERSYVNDLEVCITTYLCEFRRNQAFAPPGIAGQEKILFGNIEDIYNFHKR